MSLIREGRTEAYFESCGHARPSHMCVHGHTGEDTHNTHFGEEGPPLGARLIRQFIEVC